MATGWSKISKMRCAEVAARGTSEWWTYWNVEGERIASEYRLKFNNGRLVEASLVKWKKPRSLPTAQR